MQFRFKILQCLVLFVSCTFLWLTVNAQDSSLRSDNKIETKSLGIKYDIIAFSKAVRKPWHLLSLEYSQQVGKIPRVARLNYANRFSKSGMQLEADAYPAISKKVYTYLNAGYSNDPLLFPKYRAGFSLYVSLPAAFEAEGGFRLIHFDSSIWIYTASIGKYYKRFWFNLSTYLTPGANSVSQSYFLKTRYYFNDKDYLMLAFGSGISPDDGKNNISLNTTARMSSKKAEITLRNSFGKKNVVLVNAGWMSQETEVKNYIRQINFGLGLQRFL